MEVTKRREESFGLGSRWPGAHCARGLVGRACLSWTRVDPPPNAILDELDGLRIDAYPVAIWSVDLHKLAMAQRPLKQFADFRETEVETKDVSTVELEGCMILAFFTRRACWGS